ncbi:MAG: type II secretion system minor pseudopilin GspI [Gammaproteobacteria bacterium]
MTVRGFTLVEVLVAFVVVGIAMLALTTTAGHYTRQSAELRDRTIAHWVASNRLAEYRIEQAFPEAGTSTGEVEQAGRRWVWRVLVSPAPGEDDLRRLDVAVATAERPDEPLVIVTGFIGRVTAFPRSTGG